jgi:CDP-glycerol glycerophosphotransferase
LRIVARPLITFVLVAFRDQAYLRDCLASILGQPFRELEVIAIDDASTDHAGEVLDDVAAEDERVLVAHLDERVSLGDTRNLGLDRATGEYVWFVTPLERIAPEVLEALAARLQADRPDVLVAGSLRSGPLGKARPLPGRDAIRSVHATGTFDLGDSPEAIGLGATLEGKVFRRAFLEEHGLRFAAGGEGHLTVTYPALLLAERIAAFADVIQKRLDMPNAARDELVHGDPFDVFEQYGRVFAIVDRPRAPLLARAMLRDYLHRLGGVPAGRRHEFFERAAESYRRHGSEDALSGAGRRERALAAGRWWELRLAEGAHGVSRARRRGVPRRLGKQAARAVKRAGKDGYYRLQRRAPVEDDLAVFAAYWYRGYACNPRGIYEKLRELAPGVRAVWIVEEKHAAEFPSDVEHLIAGTRQYYRLLARAKYFVNNVNFPNDYVKRSGTVHVQTHHGTPLKTMGLDLRDAYMEGRGMNFERLLRRAARWDYSISQNVFSTLVWERTYPTRYESLEVGYPRNDVLANATEDDVERARSLVGIEPGTRSILFAPTHREYQADYQPTVDIGRLAEELGPEFTILLRLHYFYGERNPPTAGSGAARILDVTSHASIEELCLAADCLVTDYSSLMFDYAVLDRPLVIHAPDWQEYRTLRGTYFDLLAQPPGVVTTTQEELVTAFRSGAAWGEEAARLRSAFRERFCSLEDGRASERVVRRVFLSEREDAASAREKAPEPEQVQA